LMTTNGCQGDDRPARWAAAAERATNDDARHRERPGALRPTYDIDTSELESERDLHLS
jgi:hypothetical protein